jgi:hypothetical protein
MNCGPARVLPPTSRQRSSRRHRNEFASQQDVRRYRLTIEEKGRWLFGINAIINWLISVRGIFDPVGLALAFGGGPPNYPFMLRLWMGFVFMFGCMFWEVSRHPVTKRSLAKYNLDRKDHHRCSDHYCVYERAGATAADDPHCAYELAVDSTDLGL